MKIKPKKQENKPSVWIPTAIKITNMLEENKIQYAIFGAAALAAHDIIIRPTIDIDIVVDENDYENSCQIMKEKPGLIKSNTEKDKDRIQVADFYYNDGTCVQIWKNNLYSLNMDNDSWSRILSRYISGYDDPIKTICIEDLIVSKIGRYYQQQKSNGYEANKNINDILFSIKSLKSPDYPYIIKRLKEGARRETTRGNSRVHSLDWYFIREMEIYKKRSPRSRKEIENFVSKVIVDADSDLIEYYLLKEFKRIHSWKDFQEFFMLNIKAIERLKTRWKTILSDKNGDEINPTQFSYYIKKLRSGPKSAYAKKLIGVY